jgi:hypothetical protein
LLYKIDKYPYHSLHAYLSDDASTLFIYMLQTDMRTIFGFVDVKSLDNDWMEKGLPEPTWLTALDFSEKFSMVQTNSNSTTVIAATSTGTKSGFDQRLVEIDLKNSDRKNWVELMSEDIYEKDAAIGNEFIANGKHVVRYLKNGSHSYYIYSMNKTSELVKVVELPHKGSVISGSETFESD